MASFETLFSVSNACFLFQVLFMSSLITDGSVSAVKAGKGGTVTDAPVMERIAAGTRFVTTALPVKKPIKTKAPVMMKVPPTSGAKTTASTSSMAPVTTASTPRTTTVGLEGIIAITPNEGNLIATPQMEERIAMTAPPPQVAELIAMTAPPPKVAELIAMTAPPPQVAELIAMTAPPPQVAELIAMTAPPPQVAELIAMTAPPPQVAELIAMAAPPPQVAELIAMTAPPPQVAELIAMTAPPPQVAELIAMTAPPPQVAELIAMTAPPPQVAELIAMTAPPPQVAELIAMTAPPPQVAELIAMTSPPPPVAELIAMTAPPPPVAERIAMTAPPPPVAELIAMTTPPPQVAELIAMAAPPPPVAERIAMTPVPSSSQTTTTVSNAGLQHHQLESLLDSVLVGYDRRIRPRRDQARFVTIFSDFVPMSIIEFDTQEQRFSVTGYFKMDWRDDFLTWNHTAYDDTKYLRIPVQSIWIPKLFVDKSYDGNGIVGDLTTDIALISYRGYVRWFPEDIYSVVCKVTIRFFPFDIQNCTFSYYIADEDNSTINLKHYGTIDLSEYIENAEWKLNSLTATREQVDDKFIVKYQFNVERRGGFAMFTLVVPVLMLSMLSGATFLIPIETGEKCSFSVTVFLAYGIFETVVIDTLPHNSLDVSYFILYLTSLLIVSVLLTFYTILQAKIFDALGDRKFRFCLGGKQGDGITWGTFLRKLDTYIFFAFLAVVLAFTSVFIAVMGDKFDFV